MAETDWQRLRSYIRERKHAVHGILARREETPHAHVLEAKGEIKALRMVAKEMRRLEQGASQ